MLAQDIPVIILKEGTTRADGKTAQRNNIEAAVALADVLRSTLGPRGLDKMLVDSMGDATITNDGATIVSMVEVRHPAAKMMVEVAKAQDQAVGDGTKTAVILAGELLKEGLGLVESDVHPTVVADGFRLASEKAARALEELAHPVGPDDTASLTQVASTTMASKLISGEREPLARLCVEAVRHVATGRAGHLVVDLADISVVKLAGGRIEGTELVEGVILEKAPVERAMAREVDGPRFAVVSAALAVEKTEVEARIEVREPGHFQSFLDAEQAQLDRMAEDVRASGATVLVCGREIAADARSSLLSKGVVALERVPEKDLHRLAKATGATVLGRWDDLEPSSLGSAARLEVRKVAGTEFTFVRGCRNPKAVTLFVRGGTEHVVAEVERSLHDALAVVRDVIEDGAVLPGGGAWCVELSRRVSEYGVTLGGREQLAAEAFAQAMEAIPRALAHNAGMDPIDVMIQVRRAHAAGHSGVGVDPFAREAADMWALKVVEPLRVARQAVASATEAAVMLLRIDNVIVAKPAGKGRPEPPAYPG